jgi:hypothetical protein
LTCPGTNVFKALVGAFLCSKNQDLRPRHGQKTKMHAGAMLTKIQNFSQRLRLWLKLIYLSQASRKQLAPEHDVLAGLGRAKDEAPRYKALHGGRR